MLSLRSGGVIIKKFISLAAAVALVCCFCGLSAYARTGSDPKEPEVKSATPAEKTQAQEKLKADVTNLVADAKAGKLKVPAQQFPQPKRNNLSTGAKIGIIAAIAGTIVAIVILNHVTSDND